jgi:hypothetical protein
MREENLEPLLCLLLLARHAMIGIAFAMMQATWFHEIRRFFELLIRNRWL